MVRNPNFMDSGTVLFRAKDADEALSIVRDILSRGGGTVSGEGMDLSLDYSSLLHTRIIEARIEECSEPGVYAAVFREGNCGRLIRFALPSRAALRRMDSIRDAVRAYQKR